MATGIFTLKTSMLLKTCMLLPAKCPIPIPDAMHKATHNVKYFSKKPICFV
jgi:hypothetical protein